MLGVGQPLPDAKVWIHPHQAVSLPDLCATGAVLFLFYLFDWTST